jgi:hypothetical protein
MKALSSQQKGGKVNLMKHTGRHLIPFVHETSRSLSSSMNTARVPPKLSQVRLRIRAAVSSLGKKTYGKGVVQKRYELLDGASMSLTISAYYTPNGTSINEVGITPQVPVTDETPDEIEGIMLRKVDATDTLSDFVTKWIDDNYTGPGEMPKDFSLLETELPKLQQTLEAERIHVSLKGLRQRAEQLFNFHVGIEQVVNLAHDRQLQEAIRIINNNEVEKYLNPPEETEPPSTTHANTPVEPEATTEE